MQSIPEQMCANPVPPRLWLPRALLGLMLAFHFALMVHTTLRTSACYDEGAHLAAGAAYWREGEFSIYSLSPPLLRYIAAAPAWFAGADVPVAQRDRDVRTNERHWIYLSEFQKANPGKMVQYIRWGRWMLLPFSLATAWLIYRWSAQLYGSGGGLLSCSMWCFSPLVIAHGATLGTDMGCTFAMTAVVYLWLKYLRRPTAGNALGTSAIFATGLTMKFTVLLSGPTLAVLGGIEVLRKRMSMKLFCVGLAFCVIVGFVGFNAIYRFQLMGDRLGDSYFQSHTLNHLQQSLPAWLPLPFHRDAIDGFDAQKFEAENLYPAVIFGVGYFGQDWRFYPAQLGMCETVGWLLLMLLTIASFVWRRPRGAEVLVCAAAAIAMVGWLFLTGLNTSLRYVLPVYPLLVVLSGRTTSSLFPVPRGEGGGEGSILAAATVHRSHSVLEEPLSLCPSPLITGRREGRARRIVLGLIVMAMIIECIAGTPRFHSFENLIFRHSQFHPIGAELDWGQGLVDVARWQTEHPRLRTALLYFGTAEPSDYGVTHVDSDRLDDADVLIVSKLLLNGMPERVGGPFVLLRCWRELKAQDPIADLDGMFVYRMDQVRQTGVVPWIRTVHGWAEAWDDPKSVPFRNRPHE